MNDSATKGGSADYRKPLQDTQLNLESQWHQVNQEYLLFLPRMMTGGGKEDIFVDCMLSIIFETVVPKRTESKVPKY